LKEGGSVRGTTAKRKRQRRRNERNGRMKQMEVIVRNIQRAITQYYKEKIGKVKAGAPIVWGDFAKLFG